MAGFEETTGTPEEFVRFTEDQVQKLVTQIFAAVNNRIAAHIVQSVTDGDATHIPSADAIKKAIDAAVSDIDGIGDVTDLIDGATDAAKTYTDSQVDELRTALIGINNWNIITVTGALPGELDEKTIYMQRDYENDTTWELFMKAGGELVNIGNTDIDISDYWSKEDTGLLASTLFSNETFTTLMADYISDQLSDLPDTFYQKGRVADAKSIVDAIFDDSHDPEYNGPFTSMTYTEGVLEWEQGADTSPLRSIGLKLIAAGFPTKYDDDSIVALLERFASSWKIHSRLMNIIDTTVSGGLGKRSSGLADIYIPISKLALALDIVTSINVAPGDEILVGMTPENIQKGIKRLLTGSAVKELGDVAYLKDNIPDAKAIIDMIFSEDFDPTLEMLPEAGSSGSNKLNYGEGTYTSAVRKLGKKLMEYGFVTALDDDSVIKTIERFKLRSNHVKLIQIIRGTSMSETMGEYPTNGLDAAYVDAYKFADALKIVHNPGSGNIVTDGYLDGITSDNIKEGIIRLIINEAAERIIDAISLKGDVDTNSINQLRQRFFANIADGWINVEWSSSDHEKTWGDYDLSYILDIFHTSSFKYYLGISDSTILSTTVVQNAIKTIAAPTPITDTRLNEIITAAYNATIP